MGLDLAGGVSYLCCASYCPRSSPTSCASRCSRSPPLARPALARRLDSSLDDDDMSEPSATLPFELSHDTPATPDPPAATSGPLPPSSRGDDGDDEEASPTRLSQEDKGKGKAQQDQLDRYSCHIWCVPLSLSLSCATPPHTLLRSSRADPLAPPQQPRRALRARRNSMWTPPLLALHARGAPSPPCPSPTPPGELTLSSLARSGSSSRTAGRVPCARRR